MIINYDKVVSFVLWGVRDGEIYREVVDFVFYFVVNVFLLGVENVLDFVNLDICLF